jgi:hypothetical protein
MFITMMDLATARMRLGITSMATAQGIVKMRQGKTNNPSHNKTY